MKRKKRNWWEGPGPFLVQCDLCQRIFTIKRDGKGNAVYDGSECECESPFTILEPKE